jgi:nicotinamide mononucleotide transporter
MNLFSIKNIFFTALGYEMSYLEFFGVLFGLIAVWLSAKANIWSWPLGIVNVILAFFLYYQIQLYPDMFLQVFFFLTNVLGWFRWANPRKGEEDNRNELRVSFMNRSQFIFIFLIGISGTFLLGVTASRLHEWFPWFFQIPSSFPFIDSFITIMSIVATYFMIQKKVESWVIWILVDIIATYLYFIKGVKFYSLEYLFFTGLAAFGLLNWWKESKTYSASEG